MDGGGTHWGRTPKFPPQIGFSAVQPAVMNSVHLAPLADSLHDLLGVSVRRDSQRRKISFWTAAEVDDDLVPGAPISGSVGAPDRSFLWISPPAADLALDTDILTPRQYISLLFGGGTNMWSNVQFAGAFASCVTGTPCIPHITLGSTAQPAPWRKSSPAIAATLRPGLAAVVSDAAGTAHGGLGSDGHQALQRLGVTSFAKTGTLLPSGATHETSRLVMLLAVRRKDGTVAKGLVLSLVIEAGGEGEAARWLGDFIVANEAQLRRLL